MEEEQAQVETSSDVIAQPEEVKPTSDVIADEPKVETKPDPDFYKNRWAEAQRKLENREKQLEEILSKVDKKLEQPQQQQYSIEELEAFAESTENDAHKIWAKKEIRKLQQEEQAKLVRQELQGWQQQQQVQTTKQRAFEEVISRNPDLIIKDQAGNFVGWNQQSPLFGQMNKYLSDPRVSNQPDALLIAEKFALADMYMRQKPQVQKTIVSQKEEIKNLQKKTMVEAGGGQDSYTPSPTDVAFSELSKSGSLADAAKLIGLRRK